jgi:hypothetical protein
VPSRLMQSDRGDGNRCQLNQPRWLIGTANPDQSVVRHICRIKVQQKFSITKTRYVLNGQWQLKWRRSLVLAQHRSCSSNDAVSQQARVHIRKINQTNRDIHHRSSIRLGALPSRILFARAIKNQDRSRLASAILTVRLRFRLTKEWT